MRVGKFNTRASLQVRESEGDDSGGSSVEYVTSGTLWVNVQSQGGTELVAAQATNAKLTHLLTTRYRTDITSDMRIVIGSMVLNVKSAFDPDQKRKELRMLCEEVLNG